jgi:hypothetical protein
MQQNRYIAAGALIAGLGAVMYFTSTGEHAVCGSIARPGGVTCGAVALRYYVGGVAFLAGLVIAALGLALGGKASVRKEPEAPAETAPTPGWYPYGGTPGVERWWDGAHWTDQVRVPGAVRSEGGSRQ